MRRRVLAVPAAGDLDSLALVVAHLAHYLSHVAVERVTVPVDSVMHAAARRWLDSPVLPSAFAGSVVGRIEAIRDRIVLAKWTGDPETLGFSNDLVLDWDVAATRLEPWASVKAAYRPNRSVFECDWRATRLGADWIAEAARILLLGRRYDDSPNESVNAFLERLGPADHAYVVGSGPSAQSALDFDLSDGVRIISHSAILDPELMAHVRPHVVAVADPIYFGPSTYADRFLQALALQSDDHELAVVTTERCAPLLRAYLPDLGERVLGLRRGTEAWPVNLDLLAEPAVRPFPAVLTHLVLPLAASLSPSIRLVGFDGWPSDDGGIGQQWLAPGLEDEVRDVRLVHPGYFEFDAADDDLDATLERLCAQIEERGIEVHPLARSGIPALRRRSSGLPHLRLAPRASTGPSLVSLTPDWISDFGHFGPFERRVHAASAAAGLPHIALASAGLEPQADWQVPLFSEATLPSGRFAPTGKHFEAELRRGLASLELPAGSAVFLYTADVWQIAALLLVAADHRHVRFVANLMRSHDWIEEALASPVPWTDRLVDLLRSCLECAAGTNVEVTVDTEALAKNVMLLTGQRVSIWPMITVSNPSAARNDRVGTNDATHIVAPVQALVGRGFQDLVALAERLHDRIARGEVRMTARWPLGADRAMARMAEQFESHGGQLLRDFLTDDQFAQLVQSADVVLIPYPTRPFRTRTSAVVVDALLAAKPVVAVRGTWAGDLVERHRAGSTYPEGDVAGLESAVAKVIGELDDFRAKAAEAREVVAIEHAPDRLIAFLSIPPGTTSADFVPGDLASLRDQTDQMRRIHQEQSRLEGSIQVRQAVREDDLLRVADSLRDEIELLRRAINYRDRAAARAEAGRPATSSKPVRQATGQRTGGRVIGLTLVVISLAALLALGLDTVGIVELEVLWILAVALLPVGLILTTISGRRRRRTEAFLDGVRRPRGGADTGHD